MSQPLVLAIEPDLRQAAIVKRIVKEKALADVAVVDTREAAIEAMRTAMPDVLLLSALMSPRDEDELIAHLKTLDNAGHLQTHTIPQLASALGPGEGRSSRGFLSAFRRKKELDTPAPGCDPDLFAEEIRVFLQRAAEKKRDLLNSDHPAPQMRSGPRESARAQAAEAPAEPVVEASSWSSPFEWKPAGGKGRAKSATPPVEPAAAAPIVEPIAVEPPVAAAPIAVEPPVVVAPIAETPIVEPSIVEAPPVVADTPAPVAAHAAAEESVVLPAPIEEPVVAAAPADIAAEPAIAAHVEAEPAFVAHVDAEPIVIEPVVSESAVAFSEASYSEPMSFEVVEPIDLEIVNEPADAPEPLRARAPESVEVVLDDALAAPPRPSTGVHERAVKIVARVQSHAGNDWTREPQADGGDRLGPLARWARVEPVRKPKGAPVTADDVRSLIASLAVPTSVASVTYPRGCRIRRVRVPPAPEAETEAVGAVILSKRTLAEQRERQSTA